jgi:CDP-diacylglycerol--glycerol-3-phosphate 3-phosphatidyltransferase
MRSSSPPSSSTFRTLEPSRALGLRLEARWWIFVAFFTASIAATAIVFESWWGPGPSLAWAGGSTLLGFGILGFVWRHRNENRRDASSPRLEAFGPGNAITVTRGLALAMAGGFLFVREPSGVALWMPAVLYTAAIVADLFDGVAARRADFATLLGARLDIELDGLGVLLAFLLAAHLGHLPGCFIAIGLARPLFAFGLWWRGRREKTTHDLPPSRHRKLLAGIQMGFLSTALWPVMSPQTLTILGACLLIPTVVGFVRDWLVVSGRVTPASASYARFHRRAESIVTRALPIVLRLLSPLALAQLALHPLSDSFVLTAAAVVGVTLVLTGLMGRLGAIAVIIAIGVHSGGAALGPPTAALLVGAAFVLVFGTGPMSLLKPEEPYVLAGAFEEA